MQPRERIRRILKRDGEVDGIPWSLFFGATPSFTPVFFERFVQQTGIHDVAEYFDFEVRIAHPEDTEPLYHTTTAHYGLRMTSNGIGKWFFREELPEAVTFSPWGVGILPWPENPGCERMFHPLSGTRTLKELEAYPAPGIDRESLERVRRKAQSIREKGYLPAAYCGSIYEWCHWLRGMEDFMVDLVAIPENAHALIEKVATFTHEFAEAHARCGVELLCFYDDYGMQDRLQVPPHIWRQFFKPWWAKVIASLRRDFPDCLFFLHSCGRIEEILPDLVEVGFDVVHPLQPECHDVDDVVERYRGQITFWGTVSAQQTLPIGSPKDVAEEVRRRMDLAMSAGNLLPSPSNTIGPEVPVENVMVFTEVCREMNFQWKGVRR
ncbi:MAG: uroporphyrinogen decarboxylase family protein [Candidatus Caldatribacteriaceae bacterium]